MDDKFKIPYINAVIRAFAKHFNLDLQSSFCQKNGGKLA